MNDNSNNPDSTTPWLRDAADSLVDHAGDAVYTEIAMNFSGDNARSYSDVISTQQVLPSHGYGMRNDLASGLLLDCSTIMSEGME